MEGICIIERYSCAFSFRWVQCQMDYLQTLDRDSARRAAIKTLPPGLPETYKRILDRLSISPDRCQIAIKALRWLIYSARPLKLEALALASVIEPKHDFDEEGMLDEDEMVVDYCGSFVRLNRQSNIVEISHISVTQYLTSRTLPDGSINTHYLDEMESHVRLLSVTLRWLKSLPTPETIFNDALAQRLLHDFSKYAVLKWPHHGRVAEVTTVGQNLVQEFMSAPVFANWVRLYERFRRKLTSFSRTVMMRSVNHPSKLYYAALLGLSSTVNHFLECGSHPDESEEASEYRFPILAAASHGHQDIVNLLLERGADIQIARSRTDYSLFFYATRDGWWSMLKRFADMEAITPEDCMLDVAVEYWGHDANVVSQFMKELITNFDVKSIINRQRPYDHVTPLHIAAQRGYIQTVLLLMNAGAKLDVRDTYQRTPLHYAVDGRHVLVARILLEKGADPTLTSRSVIHPTPLHLALETSQPELARLLDHWQKGDLDESLGETLDENCDGDTSSYDGNQPTPTDLETRRIAKRYPNDHILQELVGRSYLKQRDDPNFLSMALTAFDRSVEYNPRNTFVNTVAQVGHPEFCYICERPISGIRYLCPKHDRDICSGCIESHILNYQCPEHYSIPSSNWIKNRFSSAHHARPENIETQQISDEIELQDKINDLV